MPHRIRFWPAMAREIAAEPHRRASLVIWLIPLVLVALIPSFEDAVPAPFNLVAGTMHSVTALFVGLLGGAVQLVAARQRGGFRLAPLLISRLLLTGLALFAAHHLARSLGQPPLSHPASTTMALIATAFCMASLGLLVGHLARAPRFALFVAAQLLLIMVLAMFWLYLPLAPAAWSRLAVQTAVTGTGTRAAASALAALVGLGIAAIFAMRLQQRPIAVLLVIISWLVLGLYNVQRPGPALPRSDMVPVNVVVSATAVLPPDSGAIAPISSQSADAALASALARITRQIEKWPPAADPDLVQRARNLLIIAAVADLYDSEPLQSHLPLLVEAELQSRIPADQISVILAEIAADPAGGSVQARETLPRLGLPANTGNEARVRERVALYAAKLAARRPKPKS